MTTPAHYRPLEAPDLFQKGDEFSEDMGFTWKPIDDSFQGHAVGCTRARRPVDTQPEVHLKVSAVNAFGDGSVTYRHIATITSPAEITDADKALIIDHLLASMSTDARARHGLPRPAPMDTTP